MWVRRTFRDLDKLQCHQNMDGLKALTVDKQMRPFRGKHTEKKENILGLTSAPMTEKTKSEEGLATNSLIKNKTKL